MAERSKQYQVARRYATALFDLLSEKERTSFTAECHEFVEAYNGSPEVGEFLKNPLLEGEKKAEVLLKTFPKSAKIENVKNFFGLLCLKRREIVLPAFCQIFEEKTYYSQGKALCRVTLAREQSKSVVKSIQEKISKKIKKEVIIETKIDPTILGGFRAEVEGMVMDASLKSQLHDMKNNILTSIKG